MYEAVDHMEMELRHIQHATLPACLKAFVNLEQSAGHVIEITESLDPSLKKRLLGIVIATEDFDELLKCVQNQNHVQAHRILSSARSMEAGQLFSAWPVTVQRLGNQVEKDVHFVLDGDNASLPLGTFNELSRVLPQLLRNAIDHGIELPGYREQIGKPRVGSLRAQLSKIKDKLKISISDDGAGIDFSKLARSALEHRFIQPEMVEQYTQTGELWRIMLIPGFSTAPLDMDMKSLSGMGIGMDAVNDTVHKLGGVLGVTSELGKGTLVTIEIPLSAPSTPITNGA
jgi:two-component system chemotaxis sensor kinase CheA